MNLFKLICFFIFFLSLYSLNNSNAYEKSFVEFDDEIFSHLRGESKMFLGYRAWKSSGSYITVDDTEEKDPVKVIINLHSPKAFQYTVSTYRDFRGAEWKPMVEKLVWDLDLYKKATVLWFVFKRKNEDTGKYEVTEPLSYVYFRGDIHKKVLVVGKGYWDLSQQMVVNFSNIPSDIPKTSRYNYDQTGMNLKSQSIKDSFVFLKSVMINQNFYLNYVFRDDDGQFLDRFYKTIKFAHIAYDDKQDAQALYYFSLFNADEKDDSGLNIYAYTKENFRFESIKLAEESSDEVYQYLIIDMRKIHSFKPSLFPIVKTRSGEVVFNAERYSRFDRPFVRYYRGTTLNIPHFTKERKDQKFLFVEGVGTTPLDGSTIIIENYNKQDIQDNEESFKNFSNGGFYIIVD